MLLQKLVVVVLAHVFVLRFLLVPLLLLLHVVLSVFVSIIAGCYSLPLRRPPVVYASILSCLL